MLALVDCNNFFVSCERAFNPKLAGKPVVVLSNNDGCVVARSNEVKLLGIKMGVPLFQLKPLIQKYNIHVFSSNYELCGDMSQRVMRLLTGLCPHIEVYSIDEAFLDVENFSENTHSHIEEISLKIKKGTGIPVSIGIAPNKTLAKIANALAKTQKNKNIFYMPEGKERDLILKTFKVEDCGVLAESWHRNFVLLI